MTILEKFFAFARELPADRLAALEKSLGHIMASYSVDQDFTAEELAELDRRAAEENPEYANPDDIAAIFDKKFR